MQAYDCKDRDTASNIGCENVRKLQGPISELMDFMGLSDDKLMAKMQEGLDATRVEVAKHQGKIGEVESFIDYPTRRGYMELALKMKGMLKDIIKHEGRVPVYTGESPEDYIETALSKDQG